MASKAVRRQREDGLLVIRRIGHIGHIGHIGRIGPMRRVPDCGPGRTALPVFDN
jgi:hypothetical protein